MGILLSVLMPTLSSRRDMFNALYESIERQAAGKQVEVVAMLDNRMRTIGAKCNALLDASQGRYVTFVDDDDLVADNYIDAILKNINTKKHPEVINFRIECSLQWKNGQHQKGWILPDANDPNEEFNEGQVKRKPSQIAVWRRDIAVSARWADAQYEADSAWASQLWPKIRLQQFIHEPLYWYRWSEAGTEAK